MKIFGYISAATCFFGALLILNTTTHPWFQAFGWGLAGFHILLGMDRSSGG